MELESSVTILLKFRNASTFNPGNHKLMIQTVTVEKIFTEEETKMTVSQELLNGFSSNKNQMEV